MTSISSQPGALNHQQDFCYRHSTPAVENSLCLFGASHIHESSTTSFSRFNVIFDIITVIFRQGPPGAHRQEQVYPNTRC